MKKKVLVIILLIILICFNACSQEVNNKENITSVVSLTESKRENNTTKSDNIRENIIENPIVYDTSSKNLKWIGKDIQKVLYLDDLDLNLLPYSIKQKCIEALNSNGLDCTELSHVKIALWDINLDGTKDYFVLPFPDKYAGNLLPPLYLFLSDKKSYKMVYTPLETDTEIKILNSKTNGCFDIQWDLFGNVLNYDGTDTYIGREDNSIKVILFPIIQNSSTVCIKVGIPYHISDLTKYKLMACLFYDDFNNSLIVTSNDENFNDIIYTDSPVNGIYYFYIDSENIDIEILNNIVIELKYVEC